MSTLKICALGLLAACAAGAQDVGSISGSVFDPAGAQIAEAKVSLRGIRGASEVRTDNEGRFSFLNLVPGEYTIEAETRGFAKTMVNGIRVESGIETHVSKITLMVNVPPCLRDAAVPMASGSSQVTGTVVGPNNKPRAGVLVTITVPGEKRIIGSTRTNGLGAFTLKRVPPGEYTIRNLSGFADFLLDSVKVTKGHETRVFGQLLHPCPAKGPCPATNEYPVLLCL